jgi:hypothetical protein
MERVTELQRLGCLQETTIILFLLLLNLQDQILFETSAHKQSIAVPVTVIRANGGNGSITPLFLEIGTGCNRDTGWRSLLRHCATSRKVAV